MVVGGADGTTLQCEGIAQVLNDSDDLKRCAAAYAAAFSQFEPTRPRDGVVLVKVDLTWARFRDYRGAAVLSNDIELNLQPKG